MIEMKVKQLSRKIVAPEAAGPFLFLFVILLLATGCSTFDNSIYCDPYRQKDYFSTWANRDEAYVIPEVLSLNDAKFISLEQNPSVQAAIERISAAQARVSEARAAYFPQIELQAGVLRTQKVPDWQSFGLNVKNTLTTNELSVDWILFDGFAREARVRAAKLSRVSVAAAKEDIKRTLLQGVITAFTNAQLASAQIQIASADYQFNKVLLDESRKKRAAGAASKSEVLNFEIRANFARSDLIRAKAEKSLALSVLADLMGLSSHRITPEIRLDPLPEGILDIPVFYLDSEVNFAMEHRPDILAQIATVEQAEAAVQAALAEFYPIVAFQASVGHQNLDGISIQERDRATSFGVFANWPIFTGGARIARLNAAKAQKSEQEQLLEQLQLSIISETEQALISLEEASEQAAILEENLRLSEETRDLVRKEWRAGQASLTRLNEVQSDLVQAQGAFASEVVRLRQARERLDIVTGRDLLNYQEME